MVIQRWQSLFLLLAGALMVAFTFTSLGQFQLTDYTLNFFTWGIFSEGVPTDGSQPFVQRTLYLLVLACLGIALPLISIFLYRNLKLQKRVVALAIFFNIALIAVTAVVGYCTIEGAHVDWSAIVFSPFVALVLEIISWRMINSDKKTIEQADRLR